MYYLYLILAFGFSISIALFAVQNAVPVVIKLLYWSLETSLVLVILGSACLGVLITSSISMIMHIRQRFNLKRANSRIKELENELASLQKPAEENDGTTSEEEKNISVTNSNTVS